MPRKPTRREKYAETQKLLEANEGSMQDNKKKQTLGRRIQQALANEYLFVIGTVFLVCTWSIQTFPVPEIDKALRYLDIQFANWTNITHHQQLMHVQIIEFRLNSDKYSALKGFDGDSLFLAHEMSRDLTYCSGAMLQLENMYLYRYGEDSLENVMQRKKRQTDSMRNIIKHADFKKRIVDYYAESASGLIQLTNSIENEIETLHETFIFEGNKRTKNLEKSKDLWEKLALATLIIGTIFININLIRKALKQQEKN